MPALASVPDRVPSPTTKRMPAHIEPSNTHNLSLLSEPRHGIEHNSLLGGKGRTTSRAVTVGRSRLWRHAMSPRRTASKARHAFRRTGRATKRRCPRGA